MNLYGVFVSCLSCLFISCNSNEYFDLSNPKYIYVEPHLTVHPVDKKKLLVASMVFDTLASQRPNNPKVAFYTSKDQGCSWRESFLTKGSNYTADPWTNIRADGAYIVTMLGDDTDQSIVLYYSLNEGKKWHKKYIPNFGKGSYDHPTNVFAADDKLVIAAAQDNGSGAHGYWGIRIMVLDGSFNALDNYWFTDPPYDLTAGSIDLRASNQVGISYSKIADYSLGYQQILDTSETHLLIYDIIRKELIGQEKVGRQPGLGSFSFYYHQSINLKTRDLILEHIRHEGQRQLVRVSNQTNGSKNWKNGFVLHSIGSGDQQKPQMAIGDKENAVLYWRQLDKDQKRMQGKVALLDVETFDIDSIIDLHTPISLDSLDMLKRTFIKSNSVFDRYYHGGEYIGLSIVDDKAYLVYPREQNGSYQLGFRSIDLHDQD